ncbi:MAG: tetratricopeptide repeat protein [Clostridia bacterium]|nr:tetratricopeptide repeat protein [Clostridia bacterium]
MKDISFKELKKFLKGSGDNKLIDALDSVLGFAICITSIGAGTEVLKLVTAKNELIKPGKALLDKLKALKPKDSKEDLDKMESVYSLLTYTAFFEALEKSLPDLMKKVNLKINEKAKLSSPTTNLNAESNDALIDDMLSKHCVYNEFSMDEGKKKALLIELYQSMSNHFLEFLEKLEVWEKSDENTKTETTKSLDELPENAWEYFKGQYLALKKENEGFRYWADQKEKIEIYNKIPSKPTLKEVPVDLTNITYKGEGIIGRETELEELHTRLSNSRMVLVVNGIGGIGKTALCREYIQKCRCQYKYAAWVNCTGRIRDSIVTTLGNSLREHIYFEEKDNMDQRFDKILCFLNVLDGKVLLVIDNIGQYTQEEINALNNLKAAVLASSRYLLTGFESYPLGFMNMENCMRLFYIHYTLEKQDRLVKEIIECAGLHTLTVELLAKTAKYARKRLSDFYEILKEKGFSLKGLSNTLSATSTTSWDGDIERRRIIDHILKVFDMSKLDESEAYILMNLSILPSIATDCEELAGWLGLESPDTLNFLVEKGWLTDQGFDVLIHPVVAESVRELTKPNARKCQTLIESLELLLDYDSYENWLRKIKYIVYAESVIKHLEGNRTESFARLYNNIAVIYHGIGNFEKALKFSLRALELRKELLGEQHPDFAISLNKIALVYHDMGNFGKALECSLRALELRKELLGEQSQDFATSLNTIAVIYQAMGNFDKALEFSLRAFDLYKGLLGEQHPHVATSLNNLAVIYQAIGDFDKSLEFSLQALELRKKLLGEQHPDFATSLNNIAAIYEAIGNFDKALEFSLQALKLRKELLGEQHPDFATSLSNSAAIYQAIDDFDKALEFSLQALELRKELLGKRHPHVATSLNNIAGIYKDMDDFEKALEFSRQALELRKELLGERHPHVADSLNNIAVLYKDTGDFDKALEFSLQALELRKELLGEQHPDFTSSLNSIALLYKAMGSFDNALEFSLRALELSKGLLGERNRHVATSLNIIAAIYKDTGDFEKALVHYQQALKICEETLGESHPTTQTVSMNQ